MRFLGLALLGGVLAGCADTTQLAPTAEAGRAPNYRNGMRQYQIFCAECHDTGEQDAPTLDDVEAWDERAFEWSSVMRQHASVGYLEMPAKGDHPALSEESMHDILHYMTIRIAAEEEAE